MPQLNPAPWLAILLFSWAVLATVVPLKVLSHKFPNNPTHVETKTLQSKLWNWPWH
uniref:ATP synthase complex subunit 8 n=1 Tax=Microphis brachyurus TaxID=161466 RepID=A7E1H0_MICBA|nr:ATP synthase F0 subunit 8 [Oostethus brachyurus]BAF74981.1 ATPase subunit 8 [Oostethus brachyurus]